MNRTRTVTLVIFLQLLFFSLSSAALAKKSVTILYSGCTHGQIYTTEG